MLIFCTNFIADMPNTQFWKITNEAVTNAVHSARGRSDAFLRKDWKSKQASRSGSRFFVTKTQIRMLGEGTFVRN